jgi:hypothetical protein
MPNPDGRREERRTFLLALYEMTDGDTMNWVNEKDVAGRLGIEQLRGEQIARSVVDQGWAEWRAMGGLMGITAYGVSVAEEELGSGAVMPLPMLVLSADESAAVEAFLTTYRRSADGGGLPLAGDELAEAEAEVATLEAQLRSPKPKRRIVREALGVLAGLLIGAGGNAVYTGAVELLKRL